MEVSCTQPVSLPLQKDFPAFSVPVDNNLKPSLPQLNPQDDKTGFYNLNLFGLNYYGLNSKINK